MKILITGSGGFLGKNLYALLKNNNFQVIGISINPGGFVDHVIDLTQKEDVFNIIKKTDPDVIIHCAALTNVELCETDQKQAYLNNVEATKNICEGIITTNKNCKMIYISSDYVYDGKSGNYTEVSLVNPISYYATTKLLSEKEVEKLSNHLILRTTVIFGYDHNGFNFFMQMLNAQKEKRTMKIPIDQINNPTYIHLLTEIILKNIKSNLKGIYLATGPQSISRFDFANIICNKFNFNKNLITGIITSDLGQKAKRPLNCSTLPLKLQKDLEMTFPSLNNSLDELKKILTTKTI